MPDLSEFIGFVSRKSGVNKPALIEQDILIHELLRMLCKSPRFAGNYLFKGGSCLVKCYFGYYRFSVDLDFTWKDQARFKVGKGELQRRLRTETVAFGDTLQDVAEELGLEFRNDPADRHYVEFGGGKRMTTYKLWKGKELVKVQVNFVEELLFPGKKVQVRTLLDRVELGKDDRAYFSEFLEGYTPFLVEAYDEREILCEKVRAALTRKAQKLRDFYDLFVLAGHGFRAGQFAEEIALKTRASLYYRKYRDNLMANKVAMDVSHGTVENPYERNLFIKSPPPSFDKFVDGLITELKEIATRF